MATRWFDEMSVSEGHGARFDVGCTTLWVERHANEWRVAHLSREDPGELTEAVRCP